MLEESPDSFLVSSWVEFEEGQEKAGGLANREKDMPQNELSPLPRLLACRFKKECKLLGLLMKFIITCSRNIRWVFLLKARPQ